MARRSSERPKQRPLSESEVDALLNKLRSEVHGLADHERSALIGILETWAHLVEVAASRSTSITDIRRMLGIRMPRDPEPSPGVTARAQ